MSSKFCIINIIINIYSQDVLTHSLGIHGL